MVAKVGHHPHDEVHGGGEVDADVGIALFGTDRRDDTNQAAVAIDQGAARPARIDGRVGLHEVLDLVEAGTRSVQRRDHAARYRQAKPKLIADGADGLREPGPRRRSQHGDIERRLDQREIRLHILGDNTGGNEAPVVHANTQRLGIPKDMYVGRQQTPR